MPGGTSPVQKRNSQKTDLEATDFIRRKERPLNIEAWSKAISMHLALPGLRGFWPMSSVDENYRAIDLSGQGRHLSYSGGVSYAIDAGLIPSVYNGAGQYLYRADEAGLDITGTEGGIYNKGLTCGGWFNRSLVTERSYLVQKNQTPGLDWPPYSLWLYEGEYPVFDVSETGAARITTADASFAQSNNEWFWVSGRFRPSTEVKLFVNNQSIATTTSIPASIYNSTGDLIVNYLPNVVGLSGLASLVFLCAAALPDATIAALFQGTRHLFGV